MHVGAGLIPPRPPVGKRWPRAWRRSPFSGSEPMPHPKEDRNPLGFGCNNESRFTLYTVSTGVVV